MKIENDLDRLGCYDKVAGRTPEVTAVSVDAGKWQIIERTSKMTDKTDVFLTVPSEEVVNCGWNKGAKISLTVRCMEETTALMFITGCHMASSDYNDYGIVEYRLDSDKARRFRGDPSTDNKSLGLWSGGRSIPIIKQMLGKKTLLTRMTPFSENPFTATFDIAGLDKAIEPLRKACKW